MSDTGDAKTMIEALRECFAKLGGIQAKPAITQWIDSHYRNRWTSSTLNSYVYACSVNNPGGIRSHPHWPRFLYDRGEGQYELYDPNRHGVFNSKGFPEGQAAPSSLGEQLTEEIAQKIDDRIGAEFAYEAHLRDYLAKNLSLLEPNLTLWPTSEGSAVEYKLERRSVDILAKDGSGVPVVIELKLSKGHDRTIGQALYYRAKLKQKLGIAKVRIILVAAEITDELRLAAGEVTDVNLFQYTLTMQLDRLKS